LRFQEKRMEVDNTTRIQRQVARVYRAVLMKRGSVASIFKALLISQIEWQLTDSSADNHRAMRRDPRSEEYINITSPQLPLGLRDHLVIN
jgi:hypothetical protein